jgi:hypothetical protein
VFLFSLGFYLLLLYHQLASFGFNPTALAFIGDAWRGERFWSTDTYVHRGFGYDGQFFYYLARDPFLTADDPEQFLDRPAYRYGRILYPALAWAAALGRPEALPWTLLGLNLLAAVGGTAAAMAVLDRIGARRWYALGYALSPPIVLGLIADLSEPISFGLIAAALALHFRRRHAWAGFSLALATLARESSALVSLGFAVHAAFDRSWRRAAAYLLPLAIPAGWHCLVWLHLGSLPIFQSPANFAGPFSGALYRAGVLLGLESPLLDTPIPDNRWQELVLVAVTVLIIVMALARIFRQRDALSIQLGLQAAAAAFTSPLVWVGLGSYARVLGLLYLLYGLVLLADRRTPVSSSLTRFPNSER